MLQFTKTSSYLPLSPLIIRGAGCLEGNGKKIYFFLARAESGDQTIYRVAVNPVLCPETPESYIDLPLNDLLARAPGDLSEPAYLLLELDFPKVTGLVTAAKTFFFGGQLFSELVVEKLNRTALNSFIFIPERRRRKQGLTLVDHQIAVLPRKLAIKADKHWRPWKGEII